MQYPVERRADRLLREMGHQAEGKSEPIVEPTAAAEKLNMDLESPVTTQALSRLLELGYLERTQNPAPGHHHGHLPAHRGGGRQSRKTSRRVSPCAIGHDNLRAILGPPLKSHRPNGRCASI